MSRITHKWVKSHINESCHRSFGRRLAANWWMESHVTHEWAVTSHMNESCHTWRSHVTQEWVMSRVDESCHTWMSHVTALLADYIVNGEFDDWKVMSHMNEQSRHTWISHVTNEQVLSHKNKSHVNESFRTWMSHVTAILADYWRRIWWLKSHVTNEWAVTSHMN